MRIIALVLVVFMAGCAGGCQSAAEQMAALQKEISVQAGENATLCWRATVRNTNPFIASVDFEIKGMEIPDKIDPNNINTQELMEAIDGTICPR